MAEYTMTVKNICEVYAGYDEPQSYLKVGEVLQRSAPKVFDFDFPLFDESYRDVLERKILLHYYTREIGLETVGLWKLKLMTKLNEIMPYYNQLYKSATLEFNPLYDFDYEKTHKGKGQSDGSGSNSSTSDSKYDTDTENQSKRIYQDTPQGAVRLEDLEVDSNAYVTDVTHNGNKETSKNTSEANNSSEYENKVNTLEEYAEVVKGKHGSSSYSSLLKEFRETFLNIDMMIIDELEVLFFQLW